MFILYVYAFKIAPDVMIHQKLLDWWAVSADETGKFHDQLDCLNVALTDIKYKFLMLFFSKMNFIFKASAFLWDKMYHSQHLKAEALRKIKIIMKQRQGNTRKTHFYTWRKHNQGNTRSYLRQRLVGYLSVKKCSSWQAKASTRLRLKMALIVLIKKRN